jgi:hypothetical protein
LLNQQSPTPLPGRLERREATWKAIRDPAQDLAAKPLRLG